MPDILGLPVSPAGNGTETILPPCPGRTVWDILIEQWEDQGTVRHMLDVIHSGELSRAAKPPPLQVKITDITSPISALTMDPDAHTVAFTVRNPEPDVTLVAEPVYPAPDLQFEDDTSTVTLAALDGHTAELPAIEALVIEAPRAEEPVPQLKKPARRRARRPKEPGNA